jgi:hypothetical protein
MSAGEPPSGRSLKVIAQSGYLPQLPVLVRVEIRDATGRRDWSLWDGEAALSTDTAGITLSTNRIRLWNGLGTGQVIFTGGGNVNLIVTVGPLQTNRSLISLASAPITTAGGTLPGSSTTWSGLIQLTNDLTVPVGHTLTIESNTLVLINGVASGTVANDLLVNGTILSLGTEAHPVTMTCANPGLRWGQIRHNSAQPSVYRYTSITLAGRAPGEGHTGQAPVIRPSNSRITFDSCNITDHATPAGTPGKIMESSSGSDLIFTNCVLARARMGPEISGTALQFIDSYIIDMRGPDDADGIYLHDQQPGQVIRLARSVIAGGDDDGIDTLGSNLTVEDCLVRGWNFPGDDSKGISVFGGECRVWRCLLIDNTIGLSGKGGNAENVRVRIDRSTIIGNFYGVAVTNKSGTAPIIDYRITNSIILAPDAIFTQYDPADVHVDYSDVSEVWPGTSNIVADPLFANVAGHDFHLQTNSPCIDTGDPASQADADGSRADMGAFPFVHLLNPPSLSNPHLLPGGEFQFTLNGSTNHVYYIEASSNLVIWTTLGTITNITGEVQWTEANPEAPYRFYRAEAAP